MMRELLFKGTSLVSKYCARIENKERGPLKLLRKFSKIEEFKRRVIERKREMATSNDAVKIGHYEKAYLHSLKFLFDFTELETFFDKDSYELLNQDHLVPAVVFVSRFKDLLATHGYIGNLENLKIDSTVTSITASHKKMNVVYEFEFSEFFWAHEFETQVRQFIKGQYKLGRQNQGHICGAISCNPVDGKMKLSLSFEYQLFEVGFLKIKSIKNTVDNSFQRQKPRMEV